NQISKTDYSAAISHKLPKGIYILKIITNENTAFVSKIMIE
ncbi:MAG: T9SS type A sorting domain-containing protein, partial [Bacteroidia bacterium]|nr:T9SS type A sorting domain-containing protein [Bacteroidia bacterium]MCC6722633.1 T9SS type A sorting domain-containing protein [Bacteroidia bacterium]